MATAEMVGHLADLSAKLAETGTEKLLAPVNVKELLCREGILIDLPDRNVKQVKQYMQGRPLAACDGSRMEYGAFFPYTIVLERALALGSKGNTEFWNEGCISPLVPEMAVQLQDFATHHRTTSEECYPRWLKARLAQRELEVAIKAVEEIKPKVMLLDGGFLLFDSLPGWDRLLTVCEQNDTVLIGVIEEVATAELAPRLGLEPLSGVRLYDRDLLFGQLDVGQAFIVDPAKPIKKSYITVFVRWGSHPAATACDFLPGIKNEELLACLELLYNTTLPSGRGIPLLLDIVDRKVRITRAEGERILRTGLDPIIYERYFKAQRQRRYL